ncbi:MAG TPA: DNA polymerase III subunit gamma/tau [Ignavibacteriaceae bacterium]|nr:DNA polymerase III subunit gamma/tau [Ignavibacteriaceae bacterium]
MAYIVTARKWRPQKFTEVVGQEHITATLKNALKNNRLAHAYLFTGPRGVGKTTTARILAKTLNCLNPKDFEPCNECEMCHSIQNSQSLDIIEIDGASNRGIDEIRTLRESVKYAPTKGKYKVYIIDEVHMLTKESFNAFLKTLEEPPSHTIFIFATTDAHKVPLTIISRCQRFDFRRIQLDTIKTLLKKIADTEKIEIDDKTLTIIAKKSDGALRDAESYFDQVVSFCGNKIDSETVSLMLNLIDDEIYFTVSDAILEKDYKSVFKVSQTIFENGWDFIDFINGLIEHFRNIMTVVITEKTELVETAEIYRTRYIDYMDKFSESDLLRLLNFLNKTQQELRFAQNQRLKVEISLSHLIGLEKSASISEVLSKLGDVKTENVNTASEVVREKISVPLKKKPEPEVVQEKGKPEKAIKSSTAKKDIKKATPEVSQCLEFNFESIVEKWNGFIESIAAEKAFMMGPFVKDMKPLKLEGFKLDVTSGDDHLKDLLRMNEKYFVQKSEQFFGKKLTLNFILSEKTGSKNENKKEFTGQKKAASNTTKEEDSVISAIINDLGGQEIK